MQKGLKHLTEAPQAHFFCSGPWWWLSHQCKHPNDLSSSVDFLSIIPAKLFALLTSCQAFQVMEKAL